MDKPSALLIYKGVPECYALCMEYVRFIYKVRSELRRVKSMPKEEKITRKEGVRAEVAPTRSVKKLFSLAHEKATRAIVSVSLAAALASCSPSVSQAQDTTSKKGKPVAAAVEKKPVTYETIADLSELQPYLDNAKGKTFTIKPGETKQFGLYKVEIFDSQKDTTDYTIRPEGAEQEYGIGKFNPYQNVNIILLDMGENHPYIKGQMLVFADNKDVYFIYFNKQTGKYEKAVVTLDEGKMRAGPVQTGIDITNESIAIINFPKNTKPGDVISQAELASITNETYTLGSGYRSFYVYAPDKPAGTLIASIAMKY
jgi:hypothetical protein